MARPSLQITQKFTRNLKWTWFTFTAIKSQSLNWPSALNAVIHNKD